MKKGSFEGVAELFVGRIRMEQLMAITQEETEQLRRREVACKSRQLCGEMR